MSTPHLNTARRIIRSEAGALKTLAVASMENHTIALEPLCGTYPGGQKVAHLGSLMDQMRIGDAMPLVYGCPGVERSGNRDPAGHVHLRDCLPVGLG